MGEWGNVRNGGRLTYGNETQKTYIISVPKVKYFHSVLQFNGSAGSLLVNIQHARTSTLSSFFRPGHGVVDVLLQSTGVHDFGARRKVIGKVCYAVLHVDGRV